MIRTMLTTLAVALTIGTVGAQAQGLDADRTRAAHAAGGPAGTVGAMEAVAQGLATSSQDVVAQQQGRSSAADGNRSLTQGATGGASPGTVGATPGNDASH